MLYYIGVSIVSALILITIGYIWEKRYMNDTRKDEISMEVSQKDGERQFMVSALMPNTDDSISDALNYIKPSSHLIKIMERIK